MRTRALGNLSLKRPRSARVSRLRDTFLYDIGNCDNFLYHKPSGEGAGGPGDHIRADRSGSGEHTHHKGRHVPSSSFELYEENLRELL